MDNRKNIFTTIFKERKWGVEHISGGGSTIDITKTTRNIILKIIKEYKIGSMFDAACGDFVWMPMVLNQLNNNFTYIGADIVPELIDQHIKNYPKYEFKNLDFVQDTLPTCDLIFCRDALQHLAVKEIKMALANFSSSGANYLLTTTHIRYPAWKNGRTIKTGKCRDRNLMLNPFNLPDPIVIHSEQNNLNKFLGLWELPFKYT